MYVLHVFLRILSFLVIHFYTHFFYLVAHIYCVFSPFTSHGYFPLKHVVLHIAPLPYCSNFPCIRSALLDVLFQLFVMHFN